MRKVQSRIRSCVFLVLYLVAHATMAKIEEWPLFPADRYVVLADSFWHRGRLWVVGHEPLPGDEDKERVALFVLDRERGLVEKFALPEDVIEVLPFGDGFLAVRFQRQQISEHGTTSLNLITSEGRMGAVLHSTPRSSHDVTVAVSAAGDRVYVAERVWQHDVLRAFDAQGRAVWEQALPGKPADVAATSRGVVVMTEPASSDPPVMHLTAFSSAGERQWRTAAPFSAPHYRDLTFVAPNRVFVRHLLPSQGLTIVESDSGAIVADVPIPGVQWMRPASSGVLLSGDYLGSPYVAFVNQAGEMQWRQRFWIHTDRSELLQPAYLVDEQLLVLGRSSSSQPDSFEVALAPVAILSEASGRELMQKRGACLNTDPRLISDLQEKLRRDHSIVVRSNLEVRPGLTPATTRECSRPTERQYLAYMQRLEQQLGPEPTAPDPWRNVFMLELVMQREETRLLNYHWDRSICDGVEVGFTIATSLQAPESAHRLVQSVLRPHVTRMRRLLDRFYVLTATPLAIHIMDASHTDHSNLLPSIEQTMQELLAVIEGIPAEERLWRPGSGPVVYTQLAPGKFGDREILRDVKDARSTLRMLRDRARLAQPPG